MKRYYDVVMKDVNKRKLYKLKCEFKDFTSAYKEL